MGKRGSKLRKKIKTGHYAGADVRKYARTDAKNVDRVNKSLELWDSPATSNSEMFQTIGIAIHDLYGESATLDRDNIEKELPAEKFRITHKNTKNGTNDPV